MMRTENAAQRSILSVKDFCLKHPAFTEGGMRYLIFNNGPQRKAKGTNPKIDGLKESGVIVKLGRRILIDESRFFDWLDSQQP